MMAEMEKDLDKDMEATAEDTETSLVHWHKMLT